MDDLMAAGRARKLVARLMLVPVDVGALLAEHGMVLKESELDEGEAGRTFTKGGTTYIIVNKNDDPYRRRFTALHELAHHVLELPSKHGSHVPSNELERFAGRPPEERTCDVFASECLVPSHLIRPLVSEHPFSIDLLFDLSERFQASKQCIASSYVRNSRDLVAYVYSEGERVHHVISSSALRDAKIFVDYGLVPSTSAAASAAVSISMRATAEIDASDWCGCDAALGFTCYEEALHFPTWNQTHSLLTFEKVSQTIHGGTQSPEEDELLPELTGYPSWDKR
ncbi:ImmA/IrrE family metallo-endopeptidase [Xanthomonas hortorum]|uniref:ImmA/IrrE family metallo-endopeptidase n=1 Tax=Xanthomonas hortorum TaxID=56454 RepID=UPI001592DF08|nr:ImmA/IrrE family metallo-endopeptidase [Xanthomonas hortorum]NHF68445.1 ImmA/IrrE family metallo-endopeptidase [Xanthomonas hortorum]